MTSEPLQHFLSELNDVLTELSDVENAKQAALAHMNVPELDRLAVRELAIADRLRALLDHRRQVLDEAGLGQSPNLSLGKTLEGLTEDDRDPLTGELRRLRDFARVVQDRASSNWLAAYRAHQHVQRVLEIIANAGAPMGSGPRGGGLILDSRA